MPSSGSTDVLVCDHCGQPCVGVEGGRDWVHLEVTRERSVDRTHWWDVDFCSQEHAAAWLSEPLPEPVHTDGTPRPTTWADAGAVAVVLLVFGILGLGVWTAIRLLISLF